MSDQFYFDDYWETRRINSASPIITAIIDCNTRRFSKSSVIMLYALLFLCLCGGALAQLPSLGRCPEVQTTPNFDTARYVGRWYESRRYFTPFEIGAKCITADYSLGENGTIHMVNTKTSSITGRLWAVEATARVPDRANPSKLKVRFSLDPIGIESDYWVLGTDYETYAVVYNCVNVNLVCLKYAWILTRETDPPQAVIDKALEVATSNKLRKSRFSKTNQAGCTASR